MKKQRRRVVWALTIALLALPALGRDSERTAEDAARELLEVSGAGQMGVQVMQQLLTVFKSTMPDVPNDFWDEFMAGVDPNEMTELIVPIYVEHLTMEEMDASIAFYKTPAGSSVLRKMPVILQESMAVGQDWGRRLGERAEQKLRNKTKG